MTHDRKAACEGYGARDACRGDTAHNCVWLDDILGDTSSGSSSSSRKGQQPAAAKGTASAERVSGVPPNLFSARMAAMQTQFGSTLREALGRMQTPILNPAMELMAGSKPASTPAPAAPAAPAPAPSSSKADSSSSGGKGAGKSLKCTSRENIENFLYTHSGYSSVLQAPLAMHCPRSKAFNLVRCMGQTSNGELADSTSRAWSGSLHVAICKQKQPDAAASKQNMAEPVNPGQVEVSLKLLVLLPSCCCHE
jgi:hypothetical protein